MDLAELLQQPEGKMLEFKRDLSSLRPVMRTLVAFANTAGGTLVVGRDDDGAVRGVPNAALAEERLASAVADSIAPALLPDIERASVDSQELLIVRVSRWPVPYHLKKEGQERGVYVRLGSTNRRADEATLAELRREAQQLAFDQHPCVGSDLIDLDIDLARRVFAAQGREIDEAKLESLGVLIRYGRELVPSNGGVILFGRDAARQRRFLDARVRCARFEGTGKARFLDQLDIEASVLGAVDEAARFVQRNTRLAARIEGLRREDVPEYPQIALREGLVNAVAHTDYSLTGMNIRVAVFDDRLEIESPGSFPFGLTAADLKAGVSRIRNPVIARVLRELGLMEKWGSGYRRMCDDCEAGGYPLPEWDELGQTVRLVFQPHPGVATEAGAGTRDVPANVPANVPAGSELSERQQWFLERVAKSAPVRPKHLAERFGVAVKTAKRDIGDLTKRDLVRFTGPTKTGRYRMDGGDFKDLGDGRILFTPKPDEDGYVGRGCPSQDCGRYFKIIPAEITEVSEVESGVTHCPYCGQQGTSTEFATRDQLDYGASLIGHELMNALLEPLKGLQKQRKPTRSDGLQINLGVEIEDTSGQIPEYLERQDLETTFVCDQCEGGSAIYGIYGYCPHCGAHNNLQILETNFTIAERMLSLSEERAEMSEKLVEMALTVCVAAFDGWGRETCRVNEKCASKPLPKRISFQNIDTAVDLVQTYFGIDIMARLDPGELDRMKMAFQKRHLLVHKSGVVDDEYIKNTGESTALLGRKVRVSKDEVRETIAGLRRMAKTLVDGLGT